MTWKPITPATPLRARFYVRFQRETPESSCTGRILGKNGTSFVTGEFIRGTGDPISGRYNYHIVDLVYWKTLYAVPLCPKETLC